MYQCIVKHSTIKRCTGTGDRSRSYIFCYFHPSPVLAKLHEYSFELKFTYSVIAKPIKSADRFFAEVKLLIAALL